MFVDGNRATLLPKTRGKHERSALGCTCPDVRCVVQPQPTVCTGLVPARTRSTSSCQPHMHRSYPLFRAWRCTAAFSGTAWYPYIWGPRACACRWPRTCWPFGLRAVDLRTQKTDGMSVWWYRNASAGQWWNTRSSGLSGRLVVVANGFGAPPM